MAESFKTLTLQILTDDHRDKRRTSVTWQTCWKRLSLQSNGRFNRIQFISWWSHETGPKWNRSTIFGDATTTCQWVSISYTVFPRWDTGYTGSVKTVLVARLAEPQYDFYWSLYIPYPTLETTVQRIYLAEEHKKLSELSKCFNRQKLFLFLTLKVFAKIQCLLFFSIERWEVGYGIYPASTWRFSTNEIARILLMRDNKISYLILASFLFRLGEGGECAAL